MPLPRPVETPLEAARVTAVYRYRLRKGWELWRGWLLLCGFRLTALLRDLLLLDQCMCDFINYQKQMQPSSFWRVEDAVLALQSKYRTVRGRIPRAWDCV